MASLTQAGVIWPGRTRDLTPQLIRLRPEPPVGSPYVPEDMTKKQGRVLLRPPTTSVCNLFPLQQRYLALI
jgi:hypothetical protein